MIPLLRAPERRLVGAILTVGGLTALVRLSGLVKHQLIAWRFGTSDDYDAFVVAMTLPLFFAGLVETIAQSAFVPTFVAVLTRDGRAAAGRLFATTMTAALAVLVAVLLLVLAGERPLLAVVAGGFSPAKLERARHLLHAMAPLVLLAGVAGLWTAVLNAERRFATAAVAPLLTPICPILALLAGARFGIGALAVGTVAGVAAQCLILGAALWRAGLPLWPRWHGSSTALRTVATQAAPMLVGSLILSTNNLVDQTMASRLSAGSVAALDYGNRLPNFAVGIASLALGTAVLPHFSSLVVERDWAAIRRTLRTWVRYIAVATFAGALVLVPLSLPIVRLLLQRGAFTDADAQLVSRVQLCYLAEAPFYLVGILGVRLLSALGQNRTLLWISATNVITNFAGNWLLMRLIGLPGIALSTACVYAFSMVLILGQVKAKLPREGGGGTHAGLGGGELGSVGDADAVGGGAAARAG